MYSAASLNNIAFQVPVTGMKAIKWRKKQVKENVYTLENEPQGRTYGQITYECTITVYKDWWKSVCDAAPNKSPLDIAPFDWTIAYGADLKTPIATETLKNFEFKEDGLDATSGDTSLTLDIECEFAGVVRS